MSVPSKMTDVAQLKQAFVETHIVNCDYPPQPRYRIAAALVDLDALLAAEREACAGIATMHAKRPQTKREHWLCDASWQAIQDERRGEDIASVEIAAAIRGRKV